MPENQSYSPMHSNVTIQNELKELNSMLTGISNRNVYTVPDGYFDVLSHDILMAVQQDTPLAIDSNSVPAGYFDNLADSIMGKIKAGAAENEEQSSLLAGLKGINVYRIPPNYFDNLATSITDKINAETSQEENSALLDNLKGINVYQVPAGYFENLSADIISKLAQPAKVVEMKPRTSFFRYAVAAVITGLLGLSVISVLDNKQPEGPVASKTSNGISLAVLDEGIKIYKTDSFDQVLSTVSDNDIESYLKESGQDGNAALLASASEDKNLPEEIDYMTDDKTLDNLLNELNIAQPVTN